LDPTSNALFIVRHFQMAYITYSANMRSFHDLSLESAKVLVKPSQTGDEMNSFSLAMWQFESGDVFPEMWKAHIRSLMDGGVWLRFMFHQVVSR